MEKRVQDYSKRNSEDHPQQHLSGRYGEKGCRIIMRMIWQM